MSGRARFRLAICGILLIGGAGIARYVLPPLLAPETFAAPTNVGGDEPLPVLGYSEREPAAGGPPHIPDPTFFEAQTTREGILERLAKFTSTAQAASAIPSLDGDDAPEQDEPAVAEEPAATEEPEEENQTRNEVDAELVAHFQRREQARLAETANGSLKIDGGQSAESLAVSASGTVVAVATAELCRLFDIEPADASDAELKISPRTEPSAVELPGREGTQLLLDHDGEHVVYLAGGGVVWATDLQSGVAAPLDAERLSGCTLLGGGLRGGWMVAGTEQGEVILFDLQGTVLKSEETPWPNLRFAPGLQSVACDSEGEIVLAGFQNGAIRWFRRQDDRLKVDGGLGGFPGNVQSISTNGTQFAVAGELFYFVCRVPEAGEPIDVQRSMTRETMHMQTQIALSGDDSAPCVSIWGECEQIASDRRTVWLYAVDVRSGHLDRPFRSSMAKTAKLRSLAANGSLVAAVSDGSLHVAQPSGHDTPPPKAFGEMIRQLLDEERYDEIERCTRYLGDPQRRFPGYQADWISCVGQALVSENGDYRVRERRLLEWLDADPVSLTAWLALAEHYISTAWAARGSEFASEVTDFGWEMVSQGVPKSDVIVRSLLAASCREPALYNLAGGQTGIASWTHLERKRFGESAVELFPNYLDLHTSVAFYRLPRWGGSTAEVLRYIELVADAAEEEQQDAYYAVLAASLLKLYRPDADLELVPVDLDRMHRGMELPSPEGYNSGYALVLMLQTAAVKGEIAYAGFYFDQLLSQSPFLPSVTNRPVFHSLQEWAGGAHAVLVQHLKGLEIPEEDEPAAAR